MEESVKKFPVPENIITAVLNRLNFTITGLIPVLAQQFDTNEMLMMAWMNEEAIKETLRLGNVCYWSRSRQALWRKGEKSGQTQSLFEFRWDCDSDTLLILVNQIGVACHTGRKNCFYNEIRDGKILTIEKPKVNPLDLYKNK